MASVPFVRDIGGGQATLLNCFSSSIPSLGQSEVLTNFWNWPDSSTHVGDCPSSVSSPPNTIQPVPLLNFTIEINYQCFDYNCRQQPNAVSKPFKNDHLLSWLEFWPIEIFFLVSSSSFESDGQVVRQCQLCRGWKSYLNPSRERRHNVTRLEGIMLPLPRSSFLWRRRGGSS